MCSNAGNTLCILSSLAHSIAQIAANLATDGCNSNKNCDCVKPPVVDKCENLKNGKQYLLKSADGRFVSTIAWCDP